MSYSDRESTKVEIPEFMLGALAEAHGIVLKENETLRQRVAELEQDRDEWKDSTIAANTNAVNEEKRRRAIQEGRDTLQARVAELESTIKRTKEHYCAVTEALYEAQALIDASLKQEPVTWQYQSRDGTWNAFSNDKHYDDTKADGTWPIRCLYAAPAVADVLKDAQRYRWLRDRSWRDTTVCVVADPKNSVKLGSFCPSHDLLDAVIDEAIGAANNIVDGQQ